ncbi:MAG TPA: PAS domain S-box protein [Burkholderiales bacterium]|nr:PAS domain S-box protein [Burkholderiales bacterium]
MIEKSSSEQDHRRFHHRVDDILTQVQDGFVALDRDWNYVYANESAARLLRRDREELEGHNIWALFPDAVELPFHGACQRVMQTRVPEQLDQYCAQLDTWFRNHFYPCDEGISILFEDISAHKRMEAERAEERERYFLTFEQAPVGIAHVAFDGTILRANRTLTGMLHYAPGELIGHNVRSITDDRFAESDRAAWQAMRRGELSQCQIDNIYRRRDGSVFWGELTASVLVDGGGYPSYFVMIVQDVTQRRRAAESIEHERDDARAFARQLIDAIEQERQRIAREIQDELGRSLTTLKMESARLRKLLPELLGEPAGAMQEQLESMLRTIDETLDKTRGISTELTPPLLDNLGLAAALRAQMPSEPATRWNEREG